MKFPKLLPEPIGLTETQRKNFHNVQIDSVGVGLANAAAPFLPVFLTRLGASSFEVGMLTAMPALTGLLLAIPLGQFLQNQRRIVPWFSAARLGVISSYAATGLLAFLLKDQPLIIGILAIWALATVPQTMLSITFSVVMNAVAGPNHRFDLMTRRWSLMGATTAVTVFMIGQLLDRLNFPINYQIVFISMSLGGLISYYYSSRIHLDDIQIHKDDRQRLNFKAQFTEYLQLIRRERPFSSFVTKRFVFLTGQAMMLPIIPLYLVREVKASDSWIATISMTQTAIVILGYLLWVRSSRRSGTRPILIWTTFGAALYPILVSLTLDVRWITVFAGINGIFQAGLNLVFFDELMKTVPTEYSSTFVALAQGLQYFSAVLSPIFATFLGDTFGWSVALMVSGGFQLAGFAMFALNWPKVELPAKAPVSS
ncbi:MAG: MFS transporter [Bellilinea sp.]